MRGYQKQPQHFEYLRGHPPGSHASVFPIAPVQVRPPYFARGLVQSLVTIALPRPHVVEQRPCDQLLHPPSIAGNSRN